MRVASMAASKQSPGPARRDHRDRRVGVAAIDGLIEVRLFGFGGEARRRTAALRVDDDERQLGRDGEADGFGFERNAGPR